MLSVASGASAAPQPLLMMLALAVAAFLYVTLTVMFLTVPSLPLETPAAAARRKSSFAARLARAADTLF